MPSDGWCLKDGDLEALLVCWGKVVPAACPRDGATHLTHLVRLHIDRLREFAHRKDGKAFQRDFALVLEPSRGRHRHPKSLAAGVIERLAGQRAIDSAVKTGKFSAALVARCKDEILGSPRITQQMRQDALAIRLLGGGATPRSWVEGHNASTPFRLMTSELFNLVVERSGRLTLSVHVRGRHAGNDLAYSPLVWLAHEIERIAFARLVVDEFRREQSAFTNLLRKRKMRAAELGQCRDRMVKVRAQMRKNQSAGFGFNVIAHHFVDRPNAWADAEKLLKVLARRLTKLHGLSAGARRSTKRI